eukprot:scaffold188_cov429-Prasinococcus_capsulatus_cf.AAC.1
MVRAHNVQLQDHWGVCTSEPLVFPDVVRNTLSWHQDAVGLTATPPEYSGMYMLECPRSRDAPQPTSNGDSSKAMSELAASGEFEAGETWFASTAHCYAAGLSEEQRQRAARRTCLYARATFLFATFAANGITRTDDIEEALRQVGS